MSPAFAATLSPWAAVLPAALAGTHRQPFAPLPGLTPALGGEADTTEKQLLLTVANLRVVQRAGKRPLPGPAFDLGRAPAETEPELPPPGVELVRDLLQEPQPADWVDYLRLLGERGRLPLPALAALLRRLPVAHRLPTVAPLLTGQRWQWLASCEYESGAWYQLRAQPLTTGWWEVEPTQREYNQYCLGWHPSPAHQAWLLAELPTARPDQQDELLTVLQSWHQAGPLPPAVVPVLDTMLGNAKGAAVAKLLAQLPGNPLVERHWQRARPLLGYQPGAGQLTVVPATWDDTWGHDQLLQHPNGDALPLPAGLGQLRELLSWVPPIRWLATWGVSAAEAVQLAAASEHAAVVLTGWLEAAGRYQASEFARPLLACFAARPALLADIYGEPGWKTWWAVEQLSAAEYLAWLAPQLQPDELLDQTSPTHPAGSAPPAWLHWLGCGLYLHPAATGPLVLALLRACLAAGRPLDWRAERELSYLAGQLAHPTRLALLPSLETELLPQALAQPAHRQLARALTETVQKMRYLQDFLPRLGALPPPATT